MKVVGHRGWPTRYPDNVLEAVAAALEVADMVEVDVRRSADGHLVLSHDPVLGGLVVSRSTWSQLSRVRLKGGHPPARLAELLGRFPAAALNLEVKNSPGEPGFEPNHQIALDTAALARPGDLLSCFFWPSLDAVRQTSPQVGTGLLVDVEGELAAAVDHALAKGHVAVIPEWQLAIRSAAACRVAAAAGLMVAVWTLNDPSRLAELASLGVTAIITDEPGEMRRAVREIEG